MLSSNLISQGSADGPVQLMEDQGTIKEVISGVWTEVMVILHPNQQGPGQLILNPALHPPHGGQVFLGGTVAKNEVLLRPVEDALDAHAPTQR